MIYVAGIVAALVFAVALDRSGLAEIGADALKTSRRSAALLRDSTLSDDEKEKAMRAASSSLFRSFYSIGIRSVGALGFSLVALLLFHLTGLAPVGSVTSWLAQWDAIILVSVIVVAWFVVRRWL